MRITWDPAKAVENLRSHRVRFEEAGEVLRDPFALTREDPRQDEQRFVTLGTTRTFAAFALVINDAHGSMVGTKSPTTWPAALTL